MKNYFTSRHVMGSLLGGLTVLVVSDGLVSNFLINSRLGREGNPFLQAWVGEGTFLVIKIVGVLLCALILWDIFKRQPRLAMVSSLCFVVIYAGILVWNLGVVFVTRF